MDILNVSGGLDLLFIGSLLLLIYRSCSFSSYTKNYYRTYITTETSLPEFSISVVASIKKKKDIIIRNIVGSNIFNILCIIGFSGMTTSLSSKDINIVNLTDMMGRSTIILSLMKNGFRTNRTEEEVGDILIYIFFTQGISCLNKLYIS